MEIVSVRFFLNIKFIIFIKKKVRKIKIIEKKKNKKNCVFQTRKKFAL